MGTSLYYTASRSTPLTDEERRVIQRRIHYGDISNPRVESMFLGWGADTAESFNCTLDQAPGELLSGSTALPLTGTSQAVLHWLELLSNIRRAVAGATWSVCIESEAALWDDDDESYDFPGLAAALSAEFRNQAKNVTVADKASIGRSITEQFSSRGFTWNAADCRMEQSHGDIQMSVWFRPLTNNDEVFLDVKAVELKEWLDTHHSGLPVTTASRLGLLDSYRLQPLDNRLDGEPLTWNVLTADTAVEFRERVTERIRTLGLDIAHMYRTSPDELFEFHERLGNMSQELLQFFVWRGRHDLAERLIALLMSRMSEDRRTAFRREVLDPSSADKPANMAVMAHAFGLQPPPLQNP